MSKAEMGINANIITTSEMDDLLSKFTTEQLLGEIARRQEGPKPLPNPDWSGVIASLEEQVKSVASGIWNEEASKDGAQYCWEECMVAVYGDNIWEWWNSLV